MEDQPPGERNMRSAARDLFLGSILLLGAVGTAAGAEHAMLHDDAPNADLQILVGAIATVLLVVGARKAFGQFWEEFRKPVE